MKCLYPLTQEQLTSVMNIVYLTLISGSCVLADMIQV